MEKGTACDGCTMPLGAEYYMHSVELPQDIGQCTAEQLERIAEQLEITLPDRKWQKDTLVNLLRTANKSCAARVAGARAKETALAQGGGANNGRRGSECRGSGRGKGKGVSVRKSTARRRGTQKAPIQASVADLLGLCKEFGLDLGERKVSKETWLREIANADPTGDRYRSLKLEDILCCECYLR